MSSKNQTKMLKKYTSLLSKTKLLLKNFVDYYALSFTVQAAFATKSVPSSSDIITKISEYCSKGFNHFTKLSIATLWLPIYILELTR